MASPLTPDETRREGISAHPIVLADGRLWGFARPSLRLYPIVVRRPDDLGRGRQEIAIRTRVGYPVMIDRLLQGLESALDGDAPEGQLEAFFQLASGLLRLAHDIDGGKASELLAVRIDDLPRLAKEVIEVALGGPVPAAAGELDDGG